MGGLRRWVTWGLSTLALVFIVLPAFAEPVADVAVLTQPPVPSPSSAVPTLKAGADITPFLNQVVLGVEVVIDPEQSRIWPDVKAPNVGVLKAGDFLTAQAVREAI